MLPADYARKYALLWTPEFRPAAASASAKLAGIGGVLAPALEYCNLRYTNAAGKSVSERMAFKDHLLGFFKLRRGESNSGITYNSASGYSLTCSPFPVTDFPKSAIMSGFGGKLSPERLQDLIQLISYWRGWKTNVEGKTVAAISDIVKSYLGTDCNGFVGNYLRAKYSGVSVTPSTTEKVFSKSGTRKTSIFHLQTDDVLVWEGFHHVSLVHAVRMIGSDQAELDIAESRGKDHGGAQLGYWLIEPKYDPATKKYVDAQFTVRSLGGAVRDTVFAAVRITGT